MASLSNPLAAPLVAPLANQLGQDSFFSGGGGSSGAELQFLGNIPTYIQFTDFSSGSLLDTGYLEVEVKTNQPFSSSGIKPIFMSAGQASLRMDFTGANDRIQVSHGGGASTLLTGINLWDGEWHKIRLEKRVTTLWLVVDDGAFEQGITTSPFVCNCLGYENSTSGRVPYLVSFRNLKLVYDDNNPGTTTQIDASLNDNNGNSIANSGLFGPLSITGTEGVDFQWTT